MQFMTALFGESGATILNAGFSLGIVLILIVFAVWGLKVFTRAGDRMARGKQPRLSVIDTATVDGKRKVMIIRRDNVEHVIMTGGPQDLVIETGIAVPEAQPVRRPAAAPSPQRKPVQAAEMATPPAPERPVSHETVERLSELARPAPLKPRTSLRHTNLLRPVTRQDSDIIPMGPALRIDNSAGAASDSAKTGALDPLGGTGVGGRNRFFRNVVRDRS